MPPKARWYVDADTLGLAHVLANVRIDVTYCGDGGQRKKAKLHLPPCVIQDCETPDEEWIPEVTRAGLAIISRDIHIAERRGEKDAVLASAARMFAITTNDKLHNWDMLEIVVTRWREMEELAQEPGPYIYSLTRTGDLHKIDLLG